MTQELVRGLVGGRDDPHDVNGREVPRFVCLERCQSLLEIPHLPFNVANSATVERIVEVTEIGGYDAARSCNGKRNGQG